jgi:Zn-dependent protease
LLLSKLKYLLILLKFGKLGGTAISMLISVVLYSVVFGPAYAIGFVALLLVHEMGHWLTARALGVRVSAPTFIPFFGAVINMRSRPSGSLSEAAIAAGGPVLGSLGAAACLLLYGVTHNPLMLALAYVGFFLNLFNLIPMSPLDGGRILGAASRWAYVSGLPIIAFIAIWRFNPFLLFILILGAFDAWNRFRYGGTSSSYYNASPVARTFVAVGYVLLAGLLAIGMTQTHDMLAGFR